MEKKKALLILSGGRAMPNMLTVIDEKPDLIVALVSQDDVGKLPQLQSAVTRLFHDEDKQPELNVSYIVDAFDLCDIQEKCQQAVKDYIDYDWIFNITAATKVMSIGAYEVAKKLTEQGKPIRCWYVDTSHSNVVSLIGDLRDSSLFDISMDQYAAIYNCRISSGTLEDQRQYCQDHWIPFTRFLVTDSSFVDLLKDILKKVNPKPSKEGGPRTYPISSITREHHMLLEEAYKVGLLDDLQKNGNDISIRLSYTQANFLDGPWLEAYVWDEARQLGLFSDCQWNQRVIDPRRPDDKDSKNELDVSMIYKAQLLAVECKTGNDSFKPDTLYKLDSVTSLLGGRFVSKILVTSQPIPNHDRNQQKSYEDFKDKAEERGIVLVAREKLSNIREIIIEQAKTPKHARI